MEDRGHVTRARPRHAAAVALALVLAGQAGVRPLKAAAAPAPPPAAPAWLAAGSFSPADLAAVGRGEVVVRVLPPSARHEVALAGALRLEAGVEAFLALAADVRRLRSGPGQLQLGVFHEPPRDEDTAALRLDDTELAALRRCEQGDCSSKLVALAPDAFRRFDWTARDAAGRASALAASGLAAYARDVAARGPAALMRFEATRFPVALRDEFGGTLAAAAPLTRLVPGLAAYLERHPGPPLQGARQILYWSRGTFGLKPVLAVYHHVVVPPQGPTGLGAVVSTQVYAGRYFDLTLDVTLVGDDAAAPGRASYLLSVVRSRVDSLRGTLSGMKRSAIEKETREATRQWLEHFRRQVRPG